MRALLGPLCPRVREKRCWSPLACVMGTQASSWIFSKDIKGHSDCPREAHSAPLCHIVGSPVCWQAITEGKKQHVKTTPSWRVGPHLPAHALAHLPVHVYSYLQGSIPCPDAALQSICSTGEQALCPQNHRPLNTQLRLTSYHSLGTTNQTENQARFSLTLVVTDRL